MSKSRRAAKAARLENVDRIWQVFSPDNLRRICNMDERDFAAAFDMDTFTVEQPAPDDFYAFRDNGSKVLAVAHLDTVQQGPNRDCQFVNTAAGPVVFSGALDDRLGAYTILDLLPRLGIETDVLLTVGEESGSSTAAFFDPPKQYDWVIEFDRGGTDVVMYQYEDASSVLAVESAGAKVGDGIFSDICYLEHLGVKAYNWGIGYRDYHSPRAHAFLNDTVDMVARFMDFHALHAGTKQSHYDRTVRSLSHSSIFGDGWDKYPGQDDEYEAWLAETARRP